MKTLPKFFYHHTVHILSLIIVLTFYGFARLPEISDSERNALADRYGFARMALPELPNQSPRTLRAVHPSLKHISAWISSVGASIALNDLDGDGLPNDVCYVNTRTDQVIVAPVPGTGERFAPFALDPSPLDYDSATMAPMGCLPGDMNEDGLMDVLVYFWGRTPVAYLRQREAQSSKLRLAASSYTRFDLVPGGERWYTNAATFADLDGDSHMDLIVGNYFPDGARILDANASGVEQMQDSMSRAFNGGGNRLMLWSGATAGPNPTVSLREIKGVLDEETAHGWTLAVGAADLDGDLLPEVYFSNDFGPDRLLHNRSKPGQLSFALTQGRKSFTTPSSKVVGRDSFKSMGVDFGDLNGDGLLDIYVSNIASEYALEESHFAFLSTGEPERLKDGIAPYVDSSEALGLSRSGWAWDCRLGDFDNDGVLEALQAIGFLKGSVNRWPELHEVAMGNDQLLHKPQSWHRFQVGDDLGGRGHNPFFVRSRSGRYFDIAQSIGLDHAQLSRGIATADVNGDGRLDFAVANQWETSYFYLSESPNPGSFLELYLLLPVNKRDSTMLVRGGHPGADTVGRPAIGVAVTVYLPDGRRLVGQVDGGSGHSGKRSPELHFGLGATPADAQLRVEVRWRDLEGKPQSQALQLKPGQHTLLLGSTVTKER